MNITDILIISKNNLLFGLKNAKNPDLPGKPCPLREVRIRLPGGRDIYLIISRGVLDMNIHLRQRYVYTLFVKPSLHMFHQLDL